MTKLSRRSYFDASKKKTSSRINRAVIAQRDYTIGLLLLLLLKLSGDDPIEKTSLVNIPAEKGFP